MATLTAEEKKKGDQDDRAMHVRNVCVLAHVDHGKTTLCDSLIASNGIISKKLAGKMRFMDSREDEQARGITMKSSSITLIFNDPLDYKRKKKEVTKKDENIRMKFKTDADLDKYIKKQTKPYLINLIDSPGHVDFSSDVSTAVRLCDGALVIVDVVEGVCVQTHAVLQQAWREGLKLSLVLNKMDRLILELQMTPLEAFLHITQIIEEINIIINSFIAFDRMTQEEGDGDDTVEGNCNDVNNNIETTDFGSNFDEDNLLEKEHLFDPRRCNVIFASAKHCWAFHIGQFATMLKTSLSLRRDVLLKGLWGKYYYNAKDMKILKKEKGNLQPMFVALVLENLWKIYQCTIVQHKPKKLKRIVNHLKLSNIAERDLNTKDTENILKTIMSNWLPIPIAVLGTIVRKLPSPKVAQKSRVNVIWPSLLNNDNNNNIEGDENTDSKITPKMCNEVRESVENCDENGPLVIFIAKMVAVDKSDLNGIDDLILDYDKEENEGGDEGDCTDDINAKEKNRSIFMGFGRIFSGTFDANSKDQMASLYILGPKYSPFVDGNIDSSSSQQENIQVSQKINEKLFSTQHVHEIKRCRIYPFMMMGKDFRLLKTARAGNVVGVLGLEKYVIKTATISNTLACMSFVPLPKQAEPILTVAIEPKVPSENNFEALRRGLALLNHADACVRVTLHDSGEILLAALGELHLERCLKDLREKFVPNVEFDVSKPLVMFRETLVYDDVIMDKNNRSNVAAATAINTMTNNTTTTTGSNHTTFGTVTIPDKSITITITARPLPHSTCEYIVKNQDLLEDINSSSSSSNNNNNNNMDENKDKKRIFFTGLVETFTNNNSSKYGQHDWENDLKKLWSFGPQFSGANILLNLVDDWTNFNSPYCDSNKKDKDADTVIDGNDVYKTLEKSILAGFQRAVQAGPMCEEPMYGICFCVSNIEFDTTNTEKEIVEDVNLINEMAKSVDNSLSLKDYSDTNNNSNTPSLKKFGPVSGQLISSTTKACRDCFQFPGLSRRLVEGKFICNMQVNQVHLGKLYNVLNRRRADILKEDLLEGTMTFLIVARIPVAESFGLADELRKETSGSFSSPNLVFDCWQTIDLDPFFKPRTQDEREDHGESIYSNQGKNIAKLYIDNVRERKGLKSDKKIVIAAEKQRTLARKK